MSLKFKVRKYQDGGNIRSTPASQLPTREAFKQALEEESNMRIAAGKITRRPAFGNDPIDLGFEGFTSDKNCTTEACDIYNTVAARPEFNLPQIDNNGKPIYSNRKLANRLQQGDLPFSRNKDIAHDSGAFVFYSPTENAQGKLTDAGHVGVGKAPRLDNFGNTELPVHHAPGIQNNPVEETFVWFPEEPESKAVFQLDLPTETLRPPEELESILSLEPSRGIQLAKQ